eukprot:scaffold28952_cov58-Attheya_sp.AAC.5
MDSVMSCACALEYCKMGDPPPIESYAALDLGALRFEMKVAISDCRGANGGGNRIISGSANKL